jgi:peptide/nickel transport system permease protein
MLVELMRRLSRALPLLLGVVLLLPVIAAALVPELIAPAGPEVRGPAMMDVGGRPTAPPYPPGKQYWLGSDLRARDLLSRIVFGTRVTLTLALAAAAIRIMIGAGLGWAAASFPGIIRRWILTAVSISATLPSLFFAFLLIVTIGPQRGLAVFLLGIGLSGWATWTQLIYSGILHIESQPYMEAAEVIGTTRMSRLRFYLLPNLLPTAMPVAAQEVAATLLIIAELGFLGVYLGIDSPLRLSDLIGGEQPQLPFPEWGGMLAGTRLELFRWFWLPLAPAGAFLLAILGINLLADGMRSLDKAYAR